MFDGFERLRLELFLVHHLGGFFIGQQAKRFAYLEFARLAAVAAEVLEHALQLAGHFLHARRRHDFDAHRHRLDLDFDFLFVELALAQHLAEFLTRVAVGRRIRFRREARSTRRLR